MEALQVTAADLQQLLAALVRHGDVTQQHNKQFRRRRRVFLGSMDDVNLDVCVCARRCCVQIAVSQKLCTLTLEQLHRLLKAHLDVVEALVDDVHAQQLCSDASILPHGTALPTSVSRHCECRMKLQDVHIAVE